MTDTRCELTELLVDQCAHCRPAPQAEKLAVSYRFAAMYPGACSVCHDDFGEDERIGRLDDGSLACENCCEDLT